MVLLSSWQTKTYDSVTDKFMDFSFEKVFLFQTLVLCLCFWFHDFSLKAKIIQMVFFSKTHSAYMLFYKRMEPEEENGKDYKFDVSSELLEVQVDLF